MAIDLRLLCSLLLAACLSGCLVPVTLPGALGSKAVSQGVAVASSQGNLVSPNGGGLISNNAGSLTGVVRSLGSLISNNSGNYRTTAGEEIVLAGVQVRLLDAGGRSLLDANGESIVTTTNAAGQYQFEGILPVRNLLLGVELPGDNGMMLAIAPKDGPVRRVADVTVVSTLTTAYILDQFVKGQADPQSTLDKLPVTMEADLRAKAGTAVSLLSTPVTSLATPEVVKTVNLMRRQDETFDTSLEDVRKVLIAAGQSELGNGLPGTRVMLFDLRDLACTADGRLYACSNSDGVVYRLAADGRLIKVAGAGIPDPGSLDGQEALTAGFDRIVAMGLDERENLLILENDYTTSRLSRVDSTGRVQALNLDGRVFASMAPGPGEQVYGFDHRQVWRITSGGPPELLYTVPELPLQDLLLKGCDGQGVLYFHTLNDNMSGRQEAYRLDLESGSFERLELSGRGETPGFVCIDYRGNVFLGGEGGADNFLAVYSPGLPQRVLPNNLDGYPIKAATLGANGQAYVALGSLDNPVYRIENGQATHVAGYISVGVTGEVLGDATSFGLGLVSGLALSAAGELFVAQSNANYSEPSRVLRISQARQASVFAASTDWDIGLLAFGTDQSLYFRDNGKTEYDGELSIVYRIHKLAADGTEQVIIGPDGGSTGNWSIDDFKVAADGSIYVAAEGQLRQYSSTGELLRVLSGGEGSRRIALDMQGAVWFTRGSDLMTWTAATGVQLVMRDPALQDATSLAMDAAGRCYVSLESVNKVMRFRPDTVALETIAGPGGRHLAGKGVDDSLKSPRDLAMDAQGNLYISDYGHRQVKRIPAQGLL